MTKLSTWLCIAVVSAYHRLQVSIRLKRLIASGLWTGSFARKIERVLDKYLKFSINTTASMISERIIENPPRSKKCSHYFNLVSCSPVVLTFLVTGRSYTYTKIWMDAGLRDTGVHHMSANVKETETLQVFHKWFHLWHIVRVIITDGQVPWNWKKLTYQEKTIGCLHQLVDRQKHKLYVSQHLI